MRITGVPFGVTDWAAVAETEHAGEQGVARWRTVEVGNLRVRIVEYSPGYVADHWCHKGHVVFVLEGELVTELADGRRAVLTAGMSYQLADDVEGAAHRSMTTVGARLFVVD